MSENTCLEKQPLCDEMLQKMDTYWRAANYYPLVSCICWITRCFANHLLWIMLKRKL